MDARKTIWVKENETNEVCTEPGSIAQVDPSNVEVKEELQDNCLLVPLVLSGSADYIKEDPELNLEAEGTENIVSSQRRLCQAKRITTEQRAFMLDFMIKHPALATGRLTAPDAAEQKERLLRKLAAMLNSLPNGASKSKEKWMKSWQDWKSDVKGKASTLKKEMKKTGGIINSNAKLLTPLEKQLVNFLGPCIISGHEEIPDPLTIANQDSGHESNTQSDRDKEDCIEVEDYDASDCDSNEDLLGFPPEGSTLSAPDVSPRLTSAKGSVPPSQGFVRASQETKLSSASKSAKKCKRCVSGTSTRDDDPLVDITRQQLICQQEENAIRREQLLLDERKTSAIETAAAAFAGAMKALEEYLKHKREND